MPELSDLLKRLVAEGKLTLHVKVVPRSSKSELVGILEDGSLKVKLAAVPEKGKANEELRKVLARTFGVPRNQVEIVAGETSPRKLVRVTHGG
ncbi:MAG: DUF167 domain-containing protein [Bryobacteraceae bacterium]